MHVRGFCTIFSLILSLLFALLVLLAGYRKGSLDSIAIATYSYRANASISYTSRDDTPNYPEPYSPVLTKQQLRDGLHWWIVNVHYLSICIGYVGGSPTPIVVVDSCQRRPGGWEFKSDDPFVKNFQRNGTMFPVEMFREVENLKTVPSFVTLVLGVAFAIIGIFSLTAFQFKLGKTEISLGLILLATLFLTISAGCVTDMISKSHSVYTRDYNGWVTNFHGLSWAAAAFAWLGLGIGVWDFVRRRRESKARREELTFGEI